jgi:hypothetical protein
LQANIQIAATGALYDMIVKVPGSEASPKN